VGGETVERYSENFGPDAQPTANTATPMAIANVVNIFIVAVFGFTICLCFLTVGWSDKTASCSWPTCNQRKCKAATVVKG
jgi:hypothetical protein